MFEHMEEFVKGDAAVGDVIRRFLIGDVSTSIGDDFFVTSLFLYLKFSILRYPSTSQLKYQFHQTS